jgi:hypothetical protein
MQDIPLSYTVKPVVTRKSRFNDPLPISTTEVGYYKHIKSNVVFILVPLAEARVMELTNEMFFEGVSKDDKDLSDSDEEEPVLETK